MSGSPANPSADSAFNAHLDWVVQTTQRVLEQNPQSSYAPMLFLFEGGQPQLSLLAGLPESDDERREAMRSFGRQWREMGRAAPEAVFFAAEVWMARYDREELQQGRAPKPSEHPKAWEALFVMGRTSDGRSNGAEIQMKRRPDRTILPGETITNHFKPSAAPVSDSGELLAAFYAGIGERGS